MSVTDIRYIGYGLPYVEAERTGAKELKEAKAGSDKK